MKTIIFLCHGNICRSPAAEFIMKDLVKLMDPKYIEVTGIFSPRGGISIYPFASYADNEHEAMKQQRLLAMMAGMVK